MSAQIPDTMLLKDLLKATGYDCPDALKAKTFKEATAGLTNIPSGKLFAFGTAEGVVFLSAIPADDAESVDVFVPATTGLTKATGSYTKESNKVTVSTTEYARYTTGDVTL